MRLRWLGIVGSVVAVAAMLLTSLGPFSSADPSSSSLAPPHRVLLPADPAPLAGAASSLEHGGGPAHGLALRCQVTSPTGGTCAAAPRLQPTIAPGWSPLTPPFTGYSAAFAYDVSDGYAVLFGGILGAYWVSNYTWLFEAGIWKNISSSLPLLPPARANTSLAYDPNVGGVVLFGGSCAIAYTCLFNDTWAFVHGGWENLTAASPNATNTPGPRQAESLAFDASPGSGLVLFGGWSYYGSCPSSGTQLCKDTWVFNRSWSQVTPTTSPPGRYDAPMTWDPNLGADLLFGGISCYGFPPCPLTSGSTYRNDTWSYAGGTWTFLPESSPNATNTPQSRTGAAMAFDPAVAGTVLVGGRTATTWFTDTWVYAGGAWSNLSLPATAGTAPQYLGAATYDLDGGELVVAGGSVHCPANSCAPSWSFDGHGWAGIGAAALGGSTVLAAMAYDAHDGYVVAFGGTSLSGFDRGTWRYGGGVWTNITPSPLNATNSPSARFGAAMAYDAIDGYALLFGGSACPPLVGHPCRDTWKFVGGRWTNISAPTLTATNTPPGRLAAAVAYDSADQEVVLFGGAGDSGTLRDTWTYHAGNWTQVVFLVNASLPSARELAAMADDPADGYLVLFGGDGNCPNNVCGDTWTFSGSSWMQVTGFSTAPLGRYGEAMSYDAVDGYVLMYGGAGFGCPGSGFSNCPDTWSFSAGVWSELSATSAVPALYQASMVDDQRDGYVLLQGGDDNSPPNVSTYVASWAFVPEVVIGVPTVRPIFGDVGGNVTVTVSVAGGGNGSYALRWQGLPSGCAPSSMLVSFNCTTSTEGTYSIRALVNDSSGVSGDFSPWVTFQEGPAPALGVPVSSRSSADVGQSVEFTASILAPGHAPDTVRWSWSPALRCVNLPGLSLNCTAFAAGSALVATAALLDASGFTTRASSAPVAVFPDPAVTASVNTSRTDAGIPVNWSATVVGGSGGFGYEWSGLPSGCPSVSTSFVTCVPSSSSAVRVGVTVLDSNGATNQSTAPTVQVAPDPAVRLAVNRTSITLGDRITLTATASLGTPPFVYTFREDGQSFLNLTASTTTTIVPAVVGTVDYQVELIDTVGGTAVSSAVNVTIQSPVSGGHHPNPNQGTNASGGEVPLWEIGALVVVAIAAVAGAVLFAQRRRSTRGPGSVAETDSETTTYEPDEAEGPP
ncbi:MAG: hypothetical protein L3K23_07600 [Thermoplasmata archaeon]|nr:hypothetical protein [Thermoplasmata archaeon]